MVKQNEAVATITDQGDGNKLIKDIQNVIIRNVIIIIAKMIIIIAKSFTFFIITFLSNGSMQPSIRNNSKN